MAATDRPVLAFKQGLAGLFKSEKLADFTIVCGPHTFRVHKAILCALTKYFDALPNFAEGAQNSIELKAVGSGDGDDEACDDPEAVKLMVHFFYHLDYSADALAIAPSPPTVDNAFGGVTTSYKGKKKKRIVTHGWGESVDDAPTAPTSPSTDGNMLMHAKVFAAAVKYRVPALKDLAAEKFAAAVAINFNHASFAEAARIAYTTTPEDMREIRDQVVEVIHANAELLMKHDVMEVVHGDSNLSCELLRKAHGMSAVAVGEEDREDVEIALQRLRQDISGVLP
ncbi:hypothetical protein LTR85_002315 [Meristemomyces frigidus]|nr:hypothetical protein LTR85_002315 [Meristemomyces frigidus]